MRLVIRGGSIPAGKGLNFSYADILSEELQRTGVEVINRSYEGDTSFEGVRTITTEIDPFKPELLIVHFGIDDIFRPVYRSEFKENLVQMVRHVRIGYDPVILLLTSHPFANSVEMDAAVIFYRTIFEVASDLNCVYVPVHMRWMNFMYESGKKLEDLVQSDNRYPNEEGQRIYAESVLQKLMNSIK